jgi:hypothetical protein
MVPWLPISQCSSATAALRSARERPPLRRAGHTLPLTIALVVGVYASDTLRNLGFPGPCPVAVKEEEPDGSPLKNMYPALRDFPLLAHAPILPTTFCGQGRRPTLVGHASRAPGAIIALRRTRLGSTVCGQVQKMQWGKSLFVQRNPELRLVNPG